MQTDGRWWFKYTSGGYAKHWELLDEKWYYFDDQGWMKSNEWINPGGKWYYLSNDGAMLTGYNRVGGTPYFFRTSGDLVENKGEAVAEYAKTFANKIPVLPYEPAGRDLTVGVDCSGFTHAIYKNFDIDLGTTTGTQFNQGIDVTGREKPGDLIFFNNLAHVGINIGGNQVVHANSVRKFVNITNNEYIGSIDGARRVW